MDWLDKLLRAKVVFGDRFGRYLAWANLAIIGILLYEVCARYLFNAPTNWAHETSTMLFGGYCLAAGLYTQVHNKHVRIDIIYQMFGPRTRAAMDVLTGLLIITAFGYLLMVSYQFALDSWKMGEVSSRSSWGPVLYPLKAVIPLTVVLLMLNQVIYLLRDICIVLGQYQVPEEVSHD